MLYSLKRQVDGLHPDLEAYTGSDAIQILSHLSTLRDACNGNAASEASAVRALSYYLENETRDLYLQQMSMDEVDQATWPHVVHALLGRFITEEVLKESQEQVTSASQAEDEDEAAFGVRIMKASRRCRHVLTSTTLVNMYIRGLLPAIRDTVTKKLRLLPPEQRGSM